MLGACGRVALAAAVAAALVLLAPPVSSAGLPNDGRQARQWALSRGAALGIPAAWSLSQSTGVVVAVIDTGTRADHPDLAPNLWVNPGEIAGNGIDDDGDGHVDDVHGVNLTTEGAPQDITDRHGHGTLVAGVLAAAADGRGIVGVAAVAEGIRYAVEHGARIVNLSLGCNELDMNLQSAIEEAGAAEVLVVCSAGNMRRNVDAAPSYPVSLPEPNVLGVGATVAADGGRTLASFSNWGPAAVPVAAPGDRILTTSRDGRYAYSWGTSLAAPHVAGVAALVASINPEISAAALRAALVDRAAQGSAPELPRYVDASASVRSVR